MTSGTPLWVAACLCYSYRNSRRLPWRVRGRTKASVFTSPGTRGSEADSAPAPSGPRPGSCPGIPSRRAARRDEGPSSVRRLLLCLFLYWVLSRGHLDRLLDGERGRFPGGKTSATSLPQPSPPKFSLSPAPWLCAMRLVIITAYAD